MISNIYFYKTSEVVLSLRLLYSLELFKSRGKNIKLRFFFFLKSINFCAQFVEFTLVGALGDDLSDVDLRPVLD